ncbi:MAG TPA: TetR/AcrR family transcriptional regulator [Clostridiaceae bacterium]|nr:TetR/AcrR family transcriptional regulator [Clostridiaceae bacterium]
MNKSFKNLPEEKRKKIIDICIEEFAKKGYDKASTNEITRKAGISKGILFHYFGNKRNLFLYLIDYVMEYMADKLEKTLDNLPADVFERFIQYGIAKLKLAYNEPLMYEMLFNAFINPSEEVRKDIQERYEKIFAESLGGFYRGIDTSKFRKDIDIQKALELIALVLDGLGNKYLKIFKNMKAEEVLQSMDRIMEESREYMEMLKRGLCNS